MQAFICTTCGTQYPPADAPPARCPICEDERQFVPPTGQAWTTQEKLAVDRVNGWHQYEPGIIGIATQPRFAIGQRALLLRTSIGNILWDCIPFIDEATVEIVRGLGGLAAVAISHPHYYSTMVEWSHAFGGAPIHLHAADRQWIMRPDAVVHLWDGDTMPLADGVTLVRCGGHFDGGTVLHWRGGIGGKGALLTGDIIQVVADRKHVSFMYSYPNHIPLPASAVERVVRAVDSFEYERVYGAFWDTVIDGDGKAAVIRSAERYQRAIRGQ